jgi:hypothetical protein
LDGVSLTFLTKGRQGDDVTESYYETLEDNGEMAVRESGRYIRITQTILADTNWTYAEGLDIILAKGARH